MNRIYIMDQSNHNDDLPEKINPYLISSRMNGYIPYEEATDDMIQRYLVDQNFIDVSDQKSRYSLDTPEFHAQRIASLILSIII